MKKIICSVVLGAALGALHVACGGDEPMGNNTNNNRGNNNTNNSNNNTNNNDGGYACDPALGTPVGMLLNAPLDPDVETIRKTPAHAGDPGPGNLP